MTSNKKVYGNNRTVPFTDGDVKLIEFIAETIGCSKSEAVRTAVRAYATSLERVVRSR